VRVVGGGGGAVAHPLFRSLHRGREQAAFFRAWLAAVMPPEGPERLRALVERVAALGHQRADAALLQHLIRVDQLCGLLGGQDCRPLGRHPMYAVRPVRLAQAALGDQQVDRRRHLLRLEAPDDPFGSGHELVGRTERLPGATLGRAGHAGPPVRRSRSRLAPEAITSLLLSSRRETSGSESSCMRLSPRGWNQNARNWDTSGRNFARLGFQPYINRDAKKSERKKRSR